MSGRERGENKEGERKRMTDKQIKHKKYHHYRDFDDIPLVLFFLAFSVVGVLSKWWLLMVSLE